MSNKAGKIWGETQAILQNPVVEFHRISVRPGFRCSLHKHAHKWNGFYVEQGVLEIHVKKNDYDLTDVTVLRAGDFAAVKPGEYHFFQCKEECLAFEIYWPELLSEDIQRETVGGKEPDPVPPAQQMLAE